MFTVGGVVAAGQKLMDIVPMDGSGHRGQLARPMPTTPSWPEGEIRFVSVHNRSLPLFSGRVRTVSADSSTDEGAGRSYFRLEIVVPESELNRVRAVLVSGELAAGPARRGRPAVRSHCSSVSVGAIDRRAMAIG